jgi:hypothetical protein
VHEEAVPFVTVPVVGAAVKPEPAFVTINGAPPAIVLGPVS